MGFRNIIIENPAYISLKQSQLIIKTDEEHSVPAEDISALLIENRQSTVTAAALSFLGQCGCAVYICDEKHTPCAVIMPYAQHSRALGVYNSQKEATEPLKKRLWQAVVTAKIRNQAECLRLCGKKEAGDELEKIAARVKSGDSDNAEATAAQLYFSQLFGKGFYRGRDDGINAALNYGYAVLRGNTARHLAVYGFFPTVGIHHHNAQNGFNLADDMMEPLRPVVDRLVFAFFEEDDSLTSEKKRMLFNCLNLDILSGNQKHSVGYATERLVQSLAKSFENKQMQLILPELLEINQHRYE